ncbi:ABC transporter G family member 2, partial [Paramuricea clavata]
MSLRVILAVTIISFGIFRLGDSHSNTMYKKTLRNKSALCNDGSRAVYYLGLQKTSKWIIFLESGAYCLTKTQCLKRFGNDYSNVLMTSKHMPNTIGGRDLLSTSPNENELFNDNFRLLNKGLSQASQVVLSGSSAGAVGVFNLVQWLQDLFSSKRLYISISVIIDGGWFINFQESITSAVLEELYVTGKPLSRACADSTYGYPCCLSASCMLARGYYPSNVPTIFLFSMYDIYIIRNIVTRLSERVSVAENGATDLLTAIDSYGGAMNQSLFAIKPGFSNLSYFVPACFQHTFFSMSSLRDQGEMLHYSKVFTQGNALFGTSKKPGNWLHIAIRRENETISLHSTLVKWIKKRDQPIRVTDSCLGAMCNPTCPESLKLVDTAVDWGEVLNGVVLVVSLVISCVCVAMKIYFKVSTCQLDEDIIPLANVQTLTQETSQETTNGYTNIFYRTIQYLRMALRYNPGCNEMESKEFSTEEVERRERNENSGAFSPTHSCDQEMGTWTSERTKHSCTLGMNNVTLRFKQGEFIAIIGILRSGKTALLRLLSGRLTCECKQMQR